MLQQLLTESPATTGPLLPLWIASQRPRQHFLVRCPYPYVDAVIAQVKTVAVPPVRFCECSDLFRLPSDKSGTLLLSDVSELGLAEQIALYDWLGDGSDALRVIAVTTAPLAALVDRGVFLEALFHRLGAVQFNLLGAECTSWT